MYACPDAGPQKIGLKYLIRVRQEKYSRNCYLAKTIAGSHDKRYEFTQLGTYQLITSVPDMIARLTQSCSTSRLGPRGGNLGAVRRDDCGF